MLTYTIFNFNKINKSWHDNVVIFTCSNVLFILVMFSQFPYFWKKNF